MPQTADSPIRPIQALGLRPGHCAVVGLQWGDEGKGKVVDLLAGASDGSGEGASGGFDCVVRYNGGANAGHSVQVADQRYALHLIPSGILNPNLTNVVGNGVVLDPLQIVKEIRELRGHGLTIADNLRVSDRAHVVFPYHKLQDTLLEKAVAKLHGKEAVGTTGRGIGPCYADKALRSTAIRVAELLDEAHLLRRLTEVVLLKNVQLKALAEQCGEAFEPFDPRKLVDEFRDAIEVLRPHVCDTAMLLHDAQDAGKRLLFEGANATLLDIDHGTYPFVTSSNCSSLGVHTGAGIPGHRVANVIGVVKAYQTRVGGGPMPTELKDAVGDRIREVGREYGTTTGRPRRCGWLDAVALHYAARVCGATGLAITLLDVLADLPQLKIATAYRHGDAQLTNIPADAGVLSAVQPIYETLEGFEGPVSDCRRFADLPAGARRYVKRVEELTGVPVVMVSVGPRRSQSVFR